MPKIKSRNFNKLIPEAFSFTELSNPDNPDMYEPGVTVEDFSKLTLEFEILKMLHALPTDRERVILLIQILRGDGYSFNHESIAKLFNVKLRWYLRTLARVKRRLESFDTRVAIKR